jgi:hypothetical protein
MSNTSVKVAIALFMVLTPTAASLARGGGGHGGGHAGFSMMGSFARPAGSAGVGNVPISGVPRGPGNAGGLNNSTVDPSGIGNARRMATLPQPEIAAPAPRDRSVPPAMSVEPQSMGEISGGHRQPRADQVPSRRSAMDQNRADNRENAALDSKLDICRGC